MQRIPTMKTGFASAAQLRLAAVAPHRFVIAKELRLAQAPGALGLDFEASVVHDIRDGLHRVVSGTPVTYRWRLDVDVRKPLSFPPVEIEYSRPSVVAKFLSRWDAHSALGTTFASGETVDAVCRNKISSATIAAPTLLEAGLEWRDTTFVVTKASRRVTVHIAPRSYAVVAEEFADADGVWQMTLSIDSLPFGDESGLEAVHRLLQ